MIIYRYIYIYVDICVCIWGRKGGSMYFIERKERGDG